MATFAKENNLFHTPPQSTLCGKHELYLGKYLPQIIDEIGDDIDFVILDTVHSLPGEVLDFPVMLPYLKDGAIVVLHDVRHNQYRPKVWHGYATAVVLSAVTSEEKFLNFEPEAENRPYCYSNIAAFSISQRTREYIENLFFSLVITWHYVPDEKQLGIYREFYKEHYPKELVDIFNEAVKMNRNLHLMFKQK